ncbi:MAG: hypothetical protein ABJ092_04110 [Gillisia sp.]
MRERQGIQKAYKEFCLAKGSQHIASEFAIEKIKELVNRFHVERILEVGLGIGSISAIILRFNRNIDLAYTGTEANSFCLKALHDNLKEDYSRLDIVSDLAEISTSKKFDLIIIDGTDQNLIKVKDLISEHGIIAIEGDRLSQQDSVQQFFPNHKYVHLISVNKNKKYSPFSATNWQGGLKVILINPTGFQKLWWVKEKIFTKLRYWIVR